MHDELLTSLNTEPQQEDVEIQLFDQKFAFAHSRQTTQFAVPVLSDTGEVRVPSKVNKNDYWISREQLKLPRKRTCTVCPANNPPNTLKTVFLVTLVFMYVNFENWYRVLRMDGHSFSAVAALLHNECFSNDKDSFAIRVIRSQSGIAAGTTRK